MIGRLPFYVDIDDTLLMHRYDGQTEPHKITIEWAGRSVTGYKNMHNVHMVEHFYNLGRDIYFWSGTGGEYARTVAIAFGIDHLAANNYAFLTKPIDYYLDDKAPSDWVGKRIWRDPVSGDEA